MFLTFNQFVHAGKWSKGSLCPKALQVHSKGLHGLMFFGEVRLFVSLLHRGEVIF